MERAKTLEDIRAEVLSPERLNVVVSGIFGGVALLIAVVGVAGVLAFSVSARTREFGIRLAVGSEPRHLLMRVIAEGAAIAVGGLALGLVSGYWLAELTGCVVGGLKIPSVLPVAGSALFLLLAAVIASATAAARVARVDVYRLISAVTLGWGQLPVKPVILSRSRLEPEARSAVWRLYGHVITFQMDHSRSGTTHDGRHARPVGVRVSGARLSYSRGPILSDACFDVITGYTSKSTRSFQFAIHSSSRRRSSVSIS